MARADRFDRLRNRRIPLEKQASAALYSFSAGTRQQEFRYMVDSMQPIDADFTENTFAEGERVKEQLGNNLPAHFIVSFDYQGSVTSDTHIRIHSDIDLLVLHGAFVALDEGAPNSSPYLGDPLADLIDLRKQAATVLSSKFPAVAIDLKPSKAIAMSGGSLKRKIDVVIGSWWDTELYNTYKVKMARGVSILDLKVPRRIRNMPFYHNYQINDKDEKTGGLRKVIRLLKTLKYDAEPEITISSYDVTSIAYCMSEQMLTVSPNSYLQLAQNACAELKRFIDNDNLRDSLNVPNGTRKIFGGEGATLEGLKALHKELSELLSRIYQEQIISFSRKEASMHAKDFPLWKESRPKSVLANSF